MLIQNGTRNCVKKCPCLVVFAALLTVGSASLGGYLIGKAIERTWGKKGSVDARGLSERNVRADAAALSINYKATGVDFSACQKKLEQDKKIVLEFLKSCGFKDEEIQYGVVSVDEKTFFDGKNKNSSADPLIADQASAKNQIIIEYSINNKISIRSLNVDLVKEVTGKIDELLKKGVMASTQVQYLFTGESLNKIKSEMVTESIKNAKEVAAQMVKDSGAKIGQVQSAHQGHVTIRGRDSTNEYNDQSEGQSLEKTVRLITSVTFAIEN